MTTTEVPCTHGDYAGRSVVQAGGEPGTGHNVISISVSSESSSAVTPGIATVTGVTFWLSLTRWAIECDADCDATEITVRTDRDDGSDVERNVVWTWALQPCPRGQGCGTGSANRWEVERTHLGMNGHGSTKRCAEERTQSSP
jgi:hypothetical protein